MLISQQTPVILASSSKIRKKILQESKIQFEVKSPLCDEEELKKKSRIKNPKKLCLFLAEQKALSVSEKFPNHYVIGSDQVCEFEGKQISKSKNESEAISQLLEMNGKTHYQNNGLAIALNNKIIFTNFSRVKMEMRKLSAAQIKNYVKLDESWNSAGSYKYESLGKHLFSKTIGDYHSILGLSIQPLLSFLHLERVISIK